MRLSIHHIHLSIITALNRDVRAYAYTKRNTLHFQKAIKTLLKGQTAMTNRDELCVVTVVCVFVTLQILHPFECMIQS